MLNEYVIFQYNFKNMYTVHNNIFFKYQKLTAMCVHVCKNVAPKHLFFLLFIFNL